MLLRDSKSIPDKADFAAIKAKVLPEELNLLDGLCKEIGMVPNQVTDIYKMRRGRYVDVRVWSYADLGTCRFKDLFITDANLKPVSDFELKSFLMDYNDESMELSTSLLKLLNTAEVDETMEEILVSEELPFQDCIEPVETTEPVKPITFESWDNIL